MITHVDLPGNSRPAKIGADRIGDADPSELVRVTVLVRGKNPIPEPDPNSPMAISEIEEKAGADPGDVAIVADTLTKLGLTVGETNAAARSVEVEGPVSAMNAIFDVDLGKYRSHDRAEYRGRAGNIRVPAELDGMVTAVLGLDDRRVAKRHPVMQRDRDASTADAATAPQRPSDLAARYSFPPGDAQGQTVGILEFGGGYFESDMQMYCNQIAGIPMSNVNVVPVGLDSMTLAQLQAIADPKDQSAAADECGEVNMDIQVVAGLSPNANITVYFAPFNQKGWVNVLTKAIHGPNPPNVISCSWGAAEDGGDFSDAAIKAINNLLQTAAAAGVTVCISSGDDGAGDAVNDGNAHCDFPASSPYSLAVGGTMFTDDGTEVGWWVTPGARNGNGGGASGGGRSTVCPTPPWQNVDVVSVRTGTADGRCIPDVAALSGNPLYDLIFLGQSRPNGGTSASAPLWASLLARINGNGHAVGFLTPKLYQPDANGNPLGASVTTAISSGQNSVVADADSQVVAVDGYQCAPGYNAVTGWGVPIGTALQAAL